MALLDRDKVVMEIEVESATCLPGQHIIGTLRVQVLKEIEVTAIRLMARGKETVSFKGSKGHGGMREQAFLHFEQLFTFFGFSKQSGRRGGASLGEGCYIYPFDIGIPTNAPPSFQWNSKTAVAQITYTLRAIIDIPRGFDKTCEIPIRVLPTIARRQYEQLCSVSKTMETRGVPLTVDAGCFGRNSDPRASVTVSATAPAVVLIDGVDNKAKLAGKNLVDTSNTRPPTQQMIVRISIGNTSRKTRIRMVCVSLKQYMRLLADGDKCDAVRTISTTDVVPPGGELIPRATATIDVKLPLPSTWQLTPSKGSMPLAPTMSTPCIQIMNVIIISFPGLGADALVTFSDATLLEAAVDSDNRVPRVPCSYSSSTIRPEEKLGGV